MPCSLWLCEDRDPQHRGGDTPQVFASPFFFFFSSVAKGGGRFAGTLVALHGERLIPGTPISQHLAAHRPGSASAGLVLLCVPVSDGERENI